MSRVPGSTGRIPFRLSSRTPGSLGCNDAADPDFGLHVGDTPGSLGLQDCADPNAESPYSLGTGKLFITMFLDHDLHFWDYDPQNLLQDDRLCPEFVQRAHLGLSAAVASGLRPQVHEAFRSPERSDELHQKHLEGKGGKAAPGWMSVHNYGLAMDVWLYDKRRRYIDNNVKGWYKLYTQLAKNLSAFLWGEPFDDADHWEYHPNWSKPAKGADLKKLHEWALNAAKSNDPGSKDSNSPEVDIAWQPTFWWALGAADLDSPSSAYLSTNPPPVQS